MANEAYICRRGTTQPVGVTQIVDLKPNTSRRSLTYDTVPQSGYLGARVENETLAALVANATVAEYSGVAAYLIDHCIDQVTGVTITVTVANAAAVAFIAQLDAGSSIDINAAMVTSGGAGAGTTLTNAAGSNGSLPELLKILSGAKYTLAKGSVVGARATGLSAGTFTAGVYRQIYITGSFTLSLNEGVLATLISQAKSTVYDRDGNALS